jgi:peptidoglycan hydrolase-like amidase
MKETVTVSMGSKIAKFVKTAAKARRLTVSNYLKRLAREEMERALPAESSGGDAVITREEILRRLESADDPRNCIAHRTIDEFLQHFDELTVSSR